MFDLARLARIRALAVRGRLVDLDSYSRGRMGRPTRTRTGGCSSYVITTARFSGAATAGNVLDGPRLAVVLGIRRVDPEHPHKPILARRRNHIVAPIISRRPRYVAHEVFVRRDLQRKVELPGPRRRAERGSHRIACPENLDGLHARDDETEGVLRDAGAQRVVARFRVRVEADLEARLLPAVWLGEGLEVVDLAVIGQHLRLLALKHGEVPVRREQREPRVPRHLVVLHGEGSVRVFRRS